MQYKLSELIEIPKLQSLLDSFYKITGVPTSVVDIDGTILTSSGYTQFCKNFHGSNPLTRERCRKSNVVILDKLKQGEQCATYECGNGLIDIGTPIIVNDSHLATLFQGQFLIHEPDLERFRLQAREFGFDESEYIAAIKRIPVVSMEKIQPVLEFLTGFSKVLAELGYSHLREREIQKSLEISEERLSLAVKGTNDGLCDWNMKTGEAFFSSRLQEMLGFKDGELKSNIAIWKSIVHPEDCWEQINILKKGNFTGRKLIKREFRLRKKDGGYIWVDGKGTVLYDENNHPVRVVGSITDITEQKRLHKLLEQEMDFSNNIIENAGIIIIVWRVDGTIVKFNNFAQEVTGYSDSEVLGKNWIEVFLPPDLKSNIEAITESASLGTLPSKAERSILSKNGDVIEVLWKNSIVYDSEGYQCIVSMGVDITEQKKMEKELVASYEEANALYEELAASEETLREQYEELHRNQEALKSSEERFKYLAYNDTVTGLSNRTLFMQRMERALADVKKGALPGALMFLDLDDFKKINDTYGHAAGDRLLQNLAAGLKTCLREHDTVARIGGDEFTILITNVHRLESVGECADRILKIFDIPWEVSGQEIFITASIGITFFPDDGDSIQELMKNADAAMYSAKELGKNNYQFFEKNMKDKVAHQVKMEKDLRKAISKKELILYYQPQVDARTGKITSLEALLRWNHYEKGMIPPHEFIPVAEETGLIIPIGEWVLRKACMQTKWWQDQGLEPFYMSINISLVQLQDNAFVKKVSDILEETGLNPKYLELEITESILMKSIDSTAKKLRELREMGVRISLDDFGKGYSSLNYLKQLPINILKIDKSFIDDIHELRMEELFIKEIIEIAHKMKLDVTAEGVETREQFEYLCSEQCERVQGYLFSKPLPGDEIERVIAKGAFGV